MMIIKKDTIEFLNKELNLPAKGDEQDWAVELANHNRLDEFINFISQKDWGISVKYAIMCLILSSYEDMLYHKVDKGHYYWQQIRNLLIEGDKLYDDIVNYWILPQDEDRDNWFQITPLIREYKSKVKSKL